MWLETLMLVDKQGLNNSGDENYKNVLRDLGVDEVESIEDISEKRHTIIRIDQIIQVAQTNYPNITELTLENERVLYVEMNYETAKSLVYDNAPDWL